MPILPYTHFAETTKVVSLVTKGSIVQAASSKARNFLIDRQQNCYYVGEKSEVNSYVSIGDKELLPRGGWAIINYLFPLMRKYR